MIEPFTFSAQSESVIIEDEAAQATEVLLSLKRVRAIEEHNGSTIRNLGWLSRLIASKRGLWVSYNRRCADNRNGRRHMGNHGSTNTAGPGVNKGASGSMEARRTAASKTGGRDAGCLKTGAEVGSVIEANVTNVKIAIGDNEELGEEVPTSQKFGCDQPWKGSHPKKVLSEISNTVGMRTKPGKQSAEGTILIKKPGLNSEERQQGTGYAKVVLKDKGKSNALCEEEDDDMEDSGVLMQFHQDIIAAGESATLKNHHTLSADETMPYAEKSMVNEAVEGN
ncbi:hypothetical protein ACOSQ3_007685 [Xanthoceras sorbifolium]